MNIAPPNPDTENARPWQRQARLQMAVARLGLFALEIVDVPALIDEAAREIARQLETARSFVLKLHPDADNAVLIGGAGWDDDAFHEAALATGDGTLAGHALDARSPVVVTGWNEEDRFERPALFDDTPSTVITRIEGRSKPFGLLGAAGENAFSDDEVDFIRTVATVMGRAVEMRQAERDRLSADAEHGSERFQTLAQSIPQQVWTAAPDGRIDFVNRHVSEYLRLSSDEILETGLFAQMHPDDRDEAEAAWQEAQENGDTFEAEFRLQRGDRDDEESDVYRWFLGRAVPVKGRGDSIERWFGTNTDITRQKRRETEHRRLAAIVENGSDFVGSFDEDGQTLFLNEAGRREVGLRDEDTARQFNLRDFHTEEDASLLEEEILPAVRRTGRWKGEFRLRHTETGDVTPVDANFFLTRDPTTGDTEYIVAVYRDVTSYKEAQEQAEQANKAKSEFLANMSHELRTPLNAVIGYSEMIREDVGDRIDGATGDASDEDDQLIADLEQIHTAGEQLLSMVNDVLDISKIEAGEMELHVSRFDVCEMIEEVGSTVAPLIEQNDNEIEVDCPDDVGAMRADQTKLRQGLFNLLGNAAKFTQDGRVTLRVRREEIDGEPGIAFEVEDTGIGLSEEDQEKIFEAFSQADTSLTREHEGAGLGLVITRNFCKMMGGDVSVESEEGVGTTFTLHLPVEARVEDGGGGGDLDNDGDEQPDAAPEEPEPATAEQAEPGASADERADLEGEDVVLVIDDDQRARELIARHMEKEGFAVAVAASGEEGFEMARKLRPTVITLDVMMPETDGWAVLSALKDDEDLRDIPVVMVTIVDDEDMGYLLGASDYLTKPLNADRLVSALRSYRSDGAGCTVLVVEDDESTRELVRRNLDREDDFSVCEAENGRRALEQLEEGAPPDVILLDLMMPEMDGFTFLEKMHEHKDYWSIPVIVVTAKELTKEDRERLTGHVEGILEKGQYRREDLLSAVRERVQTAMPVS